MIDGALIEVGGRPALRFTRPLPHGPERVWKAVTEPEEMGAWFVAPVDWKPELGETFEAAGHVGEIVKLERPKVFGWTWASERYTFEILAKGEDECLLIFTHAFDPELGPPAQHAAGWETYLMRLDWHLDDGYLAEEDAHERFDELHSAYIDLFGRKQLPVVLEGDSVLRFQRRFEYPVERVWRAIIEPDELANWFPLEGGTDVVESKPERLLVTEWFGDTLRFELRPEGSGCQLTFTHEFGDPETSARTAAGWDRCFIRFDGLLAGEPLGESEVLRGWPAVHERYAHEFGADPAVGRAAYVGHPKA